MNVKKIENIDKQIKKINIALILLLGAVLEYAFFVKDDGSIFKTNPELSLIGILAVAVLIYLVSFEFGFKTEQSLFDFK